MQNFLQACFLLVILTLANVDQFTSRKVPTTSESNAEVLKFLRETQFPPQLSHFNLKPPEVRFNDLHVDSETGTLRFLLEIETTYGQNDLGWTDKERLQKIPTVLLSDEESKNIWAPRWTVRNQKPETIKEALRLVHFYRSGGLHASWNPMHGPIYFQNTELHGSIFGIAWFHTWNYMVPYVELHGSMYRIPWFHVWNCMVPHEIAWFHVWNCRGHVVPIIKIHTTIWFQKSETHGINTTETLSVL